jgi:hypothetical protein
LSTPAYIATVHGRAVVARPRPYQFLAGDCECAPEFPQIQQIGDFVTDPLLHRLLPDDGFRGTPTGYGEMFWLEYCDPARPEPGSGSAQVLHAGGGRKDLEVPPDLPKNPRTGEPIYATLYQGPGSPLGARESLLAIDVSVPRGNGRLGRPRLAGRSDQVRGRHAIVCAWRSRSRRRCPASTGSTASR